MNQKEVYQNIPNTLKTKYNEYPRSLSKKAKKEAKRSIVSTLGVTPQEPYWHQTKYAKYSMYVYRLAGFKSSDNRRYSVSDIPCFVSDPYIIL